MKIAYGIFPWWQVYDFNNIFKILNDAFFLFHRNLAFIKNLQHNKSGVIPQAGYFNIESVSRRDLH